MSPFCALKSNVSLLLGVEYYSFFPPVDMFFTVVVDLCKDSDGLLPVDSDPGIGPFYE